MRRESFGTVAALQYGEAPELSFADIVEDFDTSFQLVDSTRRRLTWAGPNVVLLDLDKIRVGLGWLAPKKPGAPWYLLIAVGPAPGASETPPVPGYFGALSQFIVSRTYHTIPYDAVLCGAAGQPVAADLIDTVSDLLHLTDTSEPDTRYRPKPLPTPELGPAVASATVVEREELSLPKKLTIYTLSFTMILHVPAIGAFMLVYTALRDGMVTVT